MTNSEKLLLTGLKYLDIKENPDGWNEQIRLWIYASCDSLGIARPSDDSQFAWCACWISNLLIESEIWGKDHRHIVAARKFLNEFRPTQIPTLGDICILERGPGKGHIGLYINQTQSSVKLLSGNSRDSVSIANFDKNRVLGYRMP